MNDTVTISRKELESILFSEPVLVAWLEGWDSAPLSSSLIHTKNLLKEIFDTHPDERAHAVWARTPESDQAKPGAE